MMNKDHTKQPIVWAVLVWTFVVTIGKAIRIPIVVFAAIPLLQALTTDAISLRSQLIEHLNSFGFVSTRSKGVAVCQTTSFMEFFRQEFGDFDKRLLNPVIIATVAPTFLVLLVFIHTTYRIRAFSPFSIIVLCLVCAPLAMHAVAWDIVRISTYLIGGGFIALWILAETKTAQSASNLLLFISLPALILNVFGRIPLMDGAVVRFSGACSPAALSTCDCSFSHCDRTELEWRLFQRVYGKGTPNKIIEGDEE